MYFVYKDSKGIPYIYESKKSGMDLIYCSNDMRLAEKEFINQLTTHINKDSVYDSSEELQETTNILCLGKFGKGRKIRLIDDFPIDVSGSGIAHCGRYSDSEFMKQYPEDTIVFVDPEKEYS